MPFIDTLDGETVIPEGVENGTKVTWPECLDVDGFNGTVSCSECGFVPEQVRA